MVGSPFSNFRIVGIETSVRAAKVAWVIRRRSLAARNRPPSSSSWRRTRGNIGGERFGMQNKISVWAPNSNYILHRKPRHIQQPAIRGLTCR